VFWLFFSAENRRQCLLFVFVFACLGSTAGPHFFAARWTCEWDKHGFAPSHLPVFLCFA
jgi:hypothetical protein